MRITFITAILIASFSAAAQTGSSGPDFSAFKIISDRNIFDPNRRPHYTSGPVAKIVDSFSLVGTMFYGTNSFAVFDGSHSEYRKVLETNAGIAGQIVTQIEPDAVKLSSGTNELELKVGMQMRRNEDGQWSVGNQPESFQAYQPGSSRSSSRRRSDYRTRRTETQNSAPGNAGSAPEPDATDAPPDAATPPDLEATNAPPDVTGGDPNDPVARLMRRRAQETGNENNNSNP